MSQEDRPAVNIKESQAGEETTINTNIDVTSQLRNNIEMKDNRNYSDKLRSRFGEAFLLFAKMLESNTEKKITEKGKEKIR